MKKIHEIVFYFEMLLKAYLSSLYCTVKRVPFLSHTLNVTVYIFYVMKSSVIVIHLYDSGMMCEL